MGNLEFNLDPQTVSPLFFLRMTALILPQIRSCMIASLHIHLHPFVTSQGVTRKYAVRATGSLPISTINKLIRTAVFWDVASCISYVNRRFGRRLQPPTHDASSLADFSILKMEAIHSSETAFFIVTAVRT
jgi:hypothetical protein